jgi:hypothetical protein
MMMQTKVVKKALMMMQMKVKSLELGRVFSYSYTCGMLLLTIVLGRYMLFSSFTFYITETNNLSKNYLDHL